MTEALTTTTFGANVACGHCQTTVREEFQTLELPRVTSVSFDMNVQPPKVTVESAGPLGREAVEAVLDEAGYDLLCLPWQEGVTNGQ